MVIPEALVREDSDVLASAIILWHLCEIFNVYSVQVEQGPVSFQTKRFGTLVNMRKGLQVAGERTTFCN